MNSPKVRALTLESVITLTSEQENARNLPTVDAKGMPIIFKHMIPATQNASNGCMEGDQVRETQALQHCQQPNQ